MLSFETKFGIIRKLMNKLIIKFQFRKLTTRVLAGIDQYVSTKGRVAKGGKLITLEETEKEEGNGLLEALLTV